MSSPLSCGPLLRYKSLNYDTLTWNGSLLIVTLSEAIPSYLDLTPRPTEASYPVCIYSGDKHKFWRYQISIRLREEEQMVQYELEMPRIDGSFWIPGKDQTMRTMFYSCNGFSVNIPANAFAGPALWNDVLRVHAEHHLHVMIGGGDQIYSDKVAITGPLQSWSKQKNPKRRAETPFTEQMEKELDEWYLRNYLDWFSTPPFKDAIASVPAIQIWDDHDIIDGYGSYKDRFMKTPIFLGIGKIAYKYYMLFQNHTNPNTTAFEAAEPTFILGDEVGPYIQYRSVSLCTNLGPRTVFYGLEGRVERTRERICYESTYDKMFSQLDEVVKKGVTKHLVVLVGVPIAYPRLVWLEGLLSSRYITGPLRLMNRIFGVGSGLFNKFDGSSELLDDLDDHWCAVHHKRERNAFVGRLQAFSEHKSVRITILSGDVHLAAVGRFYSASRLNIPQNKDFRYMVNIISSAITNAPPPAAVANMMHRRNKIHILGAHTHENLMALFRETPDGKERAKNTVMPARNYVIITEHAGLAKNRHHLNHQEPDVLRRRENSQAETSPIRHGNNDRTEKNLFPTNGLVAAAAAAAAQETQNRDVNGAQLEAQRHLDGEVSQEKKPVQGADDMPIARNEQGGVNAEENISAAAPAMGTTRLYALDVAFKVEINPKDPEGKTTSYGFSIPALDLSDA